MTPIETENWALRVIAAIEAGKAFEDSRVELKSVFPSDPKKAARHIAAHANSAMGEPILWLIGVDQKTGIVDTKSEELSNWFLSVKSEFDSIYPPLRDVVLNVKGKTVIALQFDTNRAPYLVKNSAGGAIQREVPWREGTSTRTATREELLLIIQPALPTPSLEILDAQLVPTGRDENERSIRATMSFYAVPRNSERVVFPFHKCFGKIICDGRIIASDLSVRGPYRRHEYGWVPAFAPARLAPPSKPVVNIRGAYESVEYEESQIIINRPTRIDISAHGELSILSYPELSAPTLEFTLGLADGDGKACLLSATLTKKLVGGQSKDGLIGWKL